MHNLQQKYSTTLFFQKHNRMLFAMPLQSTPDSSQQVPTAAIVASRKGAAPHSCCDMKEGRYGRVSGQGKRQHTTIADPAELQ